MHNSCRKLWISITLCLLAVGLVVWGVNAYKRHQEDTWYCYDTHGNPVEGVLIVCRYGLANYPKTAVTHRFSDANGKIVLDCDWDTPRELIRGISSIYSSRLRSGCPGDGERWHKGKPVPDTAVYFDEWNNKIFIKSGHDDPTIWHPALNAIIETYKPIAGRGSELRTLGMKKLEATLSLLVPPERAMFLEIYGECLVPEIYVKSGFLQNDYPDISKQDNSHLKFKDITPSLP